MERRLLNGLEGKKVEELELVVYWTLREVREIVKEAKSKEDVLSAVDGLLIDLSLLERKESLKLVKKVKEELRL